MIPVRNEPNCENLSTAKKDEITYYLTGILRKNVLPEIFVAWLLLERSRSSHCPMRYSHDHLREVIQEILVQDANSCQGRGIVLNQPQEHMKEVQLCLKLF